MYNLLAIPGVQYMTIFFQPNIMRVILYYIKKKSWLFQAFQVFEAQKKCIHPS